MPVKGLNLVVLGKYRQVAYYRELLIKRYVIFGTNGFTVTALDCNNSRTAWPISVIHIPFFNKSEALVSLLYLNNLCSSPLIFAHLPSVTAHFKAFTKEVNKKAVACS